MVDEMNAEADRLFTSGKGSTAAITDPALRKRSEALPAPARRTHVPLPQGR